MSKAIKSKIWSLKILSNPIRKMKSQNQLISSIKEVNKEKVSIFSLKKLKEVKRRIYLKDSKNQSIYLIFQLFPKPVMPTFLKADQNP